MTLHDIVSGIDDDVIGAIGEVENIIVDILTLGDDHNIDVTDIVGHLRGVANHLNDIKRELM